MSANLPAPGGQMKFRKRRAKLGEGKLAERFIEMVNAEAEKFGLRFGSFSFTNGSNRRVQQDNCQFEVFLKYDPLIPKEKVQKRRHDSVIQFRETMTELVRTGIELYDDEQFDLDYRFKTKGDNI